MKIKCILYIPFILGILFLIILIVHNPNVEKMKTDDKVYDLRSNGKDNTSNNEKEIIYNSDNNENKENINDNSERKHIVEIENIKKDNNNDDILVKDPYYYQANWFLEEIVVSEEREKLTLFDRLDGKKANVIRKTKKEYKWLEDINNEKSFVKDAFVLIPISTSSDIAYKYFFDEKGYLIKDNISKEWTVIDEIGREINSELKPIEYYIGDKNYSIEHIEKEEDSKEDVYYPNKLKSINATTSQIIITNGVVFRKKSEKIYNTLIDRDMTKYIVEGRGYQTNVKGNTYNNGSWKKALKLRKDGSYIVFENFKNNFNKVTGKIAMESTVSSDRSTSCVLMVYEKEKFDKEKYDNKEYDNEEYDNEEIDNEEFKKFNYDECIYYNYEFNYADQKEITFTFDRSIKNLVFVLYVDGKYKNRAVYFKDLRFGFNKSAYREEILRKSEDEMEINYLKSLGLYVEDDGYFDIIDEDGEIIDDFYDDVEITEDLFDIDRYYELVDRKSGPSFDKELKKLSERKIGPYYDIVGTKSEIVDKKKKSNIIYHE